MDDSSRTNSCQNLLGSIMMARMELEQDQDITPSSAISSFSDPSTSTSFPRPIVTMLPVAKIDSPKPDNRVNLARAMYKFSDFISHLHEHYQVTLPQGDASGKATVMPRSRQTSTEFRLWSEKTRRAAIQAPYIKARTQVAVQLPGLVARKSKVLSEYPGHFEEYFRLFCGDIATAAGVEHSIVHDLGFAAGLELELVVGGSWEHVAYDETEADQDIDALEVVVWQTCAFPNAYWAFCLAVAGPTVLMKIG
ncbi:hypothetical protein DOTSEDRAFT_29709 [Dothistroma septosporum NZE10]|uniref:Uncharacterized protein n=1 Tax=Dothistroma septosporum (strain NZE10 / CBS 128990) TaxID=675120 RepID=M2YHW4_DOTSN|nr:hypothetical protein DOTSEDRAFT_29709 [Dothistroma septosporum NZE10]